MPARRNPVNLLPHVRGLVLVCLVVLGFCRIARGEVALVVEQGASMYDQAATGFEQTFDGTDKVRRVKYDPGGKKLDVLKYDVGQQPQLVVAIGTNAAIAVRRQFPNSLILYCLALRPKQNNLRGSNVGGVAFDPDLEVQMTTIRRALPKAKRIGVIYDVPVSGDAVRSANEYLKKEGIRLIAKPASTPAEAARQLEDLAGNIDAFWLLWDPVMANPANFRLLVDFCIRNKIALVTPAAPFVEAGALMSIGADSIEAGRQAANMAKQILTGSAAPGDFDAEPPRVSLVLVNGKVARQLGIDIPRDVGARVLNQQ
jgi:putative tryptophan/tyrosine transport system substrate-binding protein